MQILGQKVLNSKRLKHYHVPEIMELTVSFLAVLSNFPLATENIAMWNLIN